MWKYLKHLSVLIAFTIFAYSNITGVVFKDYNADGIRQNGESGVEGVVVKAFKNGVLEANTTTDGNGNYTLELSDNSDNYRIEFELSDNSCVAQSGVEYPTSAVNSDIQFVQNGSSADFAIVYPYDIATEDNPFTFTSILVHGNPLDQNDSETEVNNITGEIAAIVKFNFKDKGLAENGGRVLEDNSTSTNRTEDETGPAWIELVKQKYIGSTFGLAYSRQAKKVFAAAVLKRTSGLGPLGAGGIYIIDLDPSNNTQESVQFVDLDEIGIATNNENGIYDGTVINGDDDNDSNDEVKTTDVIGSNEDRGLDWNKTRPVNDPAAYGQVGKLGLGDLDISEDGQYLFVVNLYDRKLYKLDLKDPQNPQAPTSSDTNSSLIPDICEDLPRGGEYRPFGLKIKKGRAYVGIVCSGQEADGTTVAESAADMIGGVYSIDINSIGDENAEWRKEVEWSFDYRDDAVAVESDNAPLAWNPWTNKWVGVADIGNIYPIPIIKDIEFDNNGDLVIGIADNMGDMMGGNEMGLSRNVNVYGFISAGDLLKAKRVVGSSECLYEGNFTGEEFYDDYLVHSESAGGALAGHHTSEYDTLLSSFEDPNKYTYGDDTIQKIWAYGVHLFNNEDGSRVNGNEGYEIAFFYLNTEAKANGIGDIETVEGIPPIEIGNRVWIDENENGIQDENEESVGSIIVKLLDEDGIEINSTTTDSNGIYFFGNLNKNTTYYVKIEKSELVDNNITLPTIQDANSSLSSNPDKVDNDAFLDEEGNAIIKLTTGDVGANDYSYDFGFIKTGYLAGHLYGYKWKRDSR